jgi:arylsulfatase
MLLAWVALGLPFPATARPPNVILILADDLGYRDLGCQGHPAIRTPVLDRLAAGGLRLTNFHSGASVCTPSRMALLTGAYPPRLGWTRGVVGYKMGMRDGMNPEALTIAEIFKSGGYATGIAGKWHVGSEPACRPHRQGFDSAYYLPASNNQTTQIRRADEVVEDPFDNRRLSERITAEAIRFIREHREKPFFLYLPYTAPHFPVEAHPDWRGRSRFGAYGDVVEELDARVGELLATLEAGGIGKDTLVVFTSDNGPQPREQASALPFRGEKWSALDGGTRVPCLISWPGTIPAGQTRDALVSAIDLLPTLCRACGIDWQRETRGKPKIDGLDLWDTLLGKDGARPRTELLHWHGMDPSPHAIRAGDWKLFFDRAHARDGLRIEPDPPDRKPSPPAGDPPPMLVNLRDDPGESIDLSGRFPAKVKELRARADTLMAEIKAGGVLPLVTPPAGD